MNYFETFGLAVDYSVDLKDLHQRYQKLQRQFHPDNFVRKTSKEKNMATKISADITAGYKVLGDDIRRGELVLNLKGFAFSIDDYTCTDTSFLMQQIELREQLENLQPVDYAGFEASIVSKFTQIEDDFKTLLLDDKFEVAAEKLVLMRFYQKIIHEVSLKK